MNDISLIEPATQDTVGNITELDVLDKTHYGLSIYSHILRKFYPGATVLHLSGKECKPAKNPFTGGNKTLHIYLKDWIFIHHDDTDPVFKGTPFDFAEQYYKLTGDELLQKLNEEMHLRIGMKLMNYNGFTFNFRNKEPESQSRPIIPKCSFFKRPVSNIYPEKEITLVEIYDLIRVGTYQEATEKLRAINSTKEAREFKARNFDYVCFSGIFSKRNDKSLLKHSGLLTIDFDHIPDISRLKTALLQDEYFDTEMLFISPSGNGLKWIISIDLTEYSHADFFNAVAAYIKQTYDLGVDKSGKDLSRACFLCHDADAYINPKYLES